MKHKYYWQVSLSNGETITENKGAYTVTTGELSPWQRLLRYIEENKLHITSVSLCAGDGTRYNLASAGKNPKFHALTIAPKPTEYNFFRKMGGDVRNDGSIANQELYHVIEAKYEAHTLQVWVDENTGNSWSMIV